MMIYFLSCDWRGEIARVESEGWELRPTPINYSLKPGPTNCPCPLNYLFLVFAISSSVHILPARLVTFLYKFVSNLWEVCTVNKTNELEKIKKKLFLFCEKGNYHTNLYTKFFPHINVFFLTRWTVFFLHFIFSIPNEEPTFFLRHQSTYEFYQVFLKLLAKMWLNENGCW